MEYTTSIPVTVASGSYQVHIGYGLFSGSEPSLFLRYLNQALTAGGGGEVSGFVLVVDATVANLHISLLEHLRVGLRTIAPTIHQIQVDGGERSKTRHQKANIEDFMLQRKCDKATVLLAVGGGVIGDLAGFVAATYYRGIRFVQVPTTMLAMVDSSVGGKTAIDVQLGKNLIGAYHQPICVLADLLFLESLCQRHMSNGMAEVIKYGVVALPDLFELCETSPETYRADRLVLSMLIATSVKYKAEIVSKDEKDKGVRNIVNMGHTIGHGIELLPTNTWLHGECVAVGMVYELMAQRAMGLIGTAVLQRLVKCLESYNLPVYMKPIDVDKAMTSMSLDKKKRGGRKHVVALQDYLGNLHPDIITPVDDNLMRRLLSPAVTVSTEKDRAGNVRALSGIVRLPGSKSIANRVLLLASIASGECAIANLPACDDISVMLDSLYTVGAPKTNTLSTGTHSVVVKGLGSRVGRTDSSGAANGMINDLKKTLTSIKPVPPGCPIPVGRSCRQEHIDSSSTLHFWVENSGTASRFITPLLALLVAQLQSKVGSGGVTGVRDMVLDGNSRMRIRPIADLVETIVKAFPSCGIEYVGQYGCLPLRLYPIEGKAPGLPGGDIVINNRVSSQYVSALLMIAPLADTNVTLILADTEGATDGPLRAVSQPFIDMTISLMQIWGVEVEQCSIDNRLCYRIKSGQAYLNPPTFFVEGDAASASYPMAIAAITGGEVELEVAPTTYVLQTSDADKGTRRSRRLQGDSGFMDLLCRMGCQVTPNQDQTGVKVRGPKMLLPVKYDMSEITDTFLTAAVLMAWTAKGHGGDGGDCICSISNIANQKVKECNRLEAMCDNLSRCGFNVIERDDGLEFYAGYNHRSTSEPCAIVVDCHDDHRIAMSMAVLSVVMPHIHIPQWRCVEKTYPEYWDMLKNDLGLHVSGSNHCITPAINNTLRFIGTF